MIKQWAECSSKELENIKTVILPIGSTEQHGNHLPVGTDHFLVNAVVEELLKKHKNDFNIGILPTINYGKSIEHLSYPGTINISATTLLNLIYDVGYSLSCQQVNNLIILNGHGGNTGILEAATYDIKYKYNINTYCMSLGYLHGFLGGKCSFPNSMHAGYAETSLMMNCYPKFKNLYSKLPKEKTQTKGFDLLKKLDCASWGWSTQELSKEGFVGDPTESNSETGASILAQMIELIVKQLNFIIEENN